MSKSIVIIGEPRIASVLSHVWTHILPDATITCGADASEVHAELTKTPDILLVDWKIQLPSAADLIRNLKSRPSYSHCVFSGIVHDAHQSSEARSVDVDVVIEPALAANVEQLLMGHFSIMNRLCDNNARVKLLESQIRYAQTNLEDVIETFQKTINTRFSEASHRAVFIEEAALWIAKQFEHDTDAEIDLEQLRYAAKLFLLGRVHLPDSEKTTRITLDGAPTNVLTASVPLMADEILKESQFFEGVRKILRSLYENYDGTGFPDRVQHWQIPLASRILRVVIDAEELNAELTGKYADTLEELKKQSRRVYDHRVVLLLDEYVNVISRRTRSELAPKSVLLVDLKSGMTLATDIVTNSGLKLMNAGTVLHSHLIDRLLSHNAMDPILGNIYITEKFNKVTAA